MKTQRMITIDAELNEKLFEEENVSLLISQLLEAHYKSKIPMTPEERKKRIEVLTAKEEYLKKIEAIDGKYKQN